MANITVQRACNTFPFEIENNATETFQLVKLAFADDTYLRV